LCGRPILPVSLIISGYSFVSTIVVEINSSNFRRQRYQTSDKVKGENGLQGRRRKALTRDIFTDCESAWDNDNFVLEINLNVLEVAREQDPSHVA
jgi:hypothetical protein